MLTVQNRNAELKEKPQIVKININVRKLESELQ